MVPVAEAAGIFIFKNTSTYLINKALHFLCKALLIWLIKI